VCVFWWCVMFIAEICLSGTHECLLFRGGTYSNVRLAVCILACSIDCVHQSGKYHLEEYYHCTAQTVRITWEFTPKVKIQDDVLRITNVVMISTLVRWVGQVARVGCQKCKKILKAGDQLGDLSKDGRIILTLTPLTWRISWPPNNASKWQMEINSAFKGLM
jgi:hypothetical protein